VIDPEIRAHLEETGVRYCLIGAQALAVKGVPRFTADIDILTMSSRVLSREFWGEPLALGIERLRRGDDDDPLGGVVRFGRPRSLDVIVGRGPLMHEVVDNAELDPELGVRVPSALHLAMLKLEAGGLQDIADVHRLIEARRSLAPGEDLAVLLDTRKESLSTWGRRALERLMALRSADPVTEPDSSA
jgi:hypothetical protein